MDLNKLLNSTETPVMATKARRITAKPHFNKKLSVFPKRRTSLILLSMMRRAKKN
ncbi:MULTISPECIES: hypothetical protein [unclassified Paraflavitalea]|uniref:hypothetical protein n=1 Tax=unclassified Paraflavitalea TaxID=2798305 RepID=UPI003D358191